MPIFIQSYLNLPELPYCNTENINEFLVQITEETQNVQINVDEFNIRTLYPLFCERLAEVNPDAELTLVYEGTVEQEDESVDAEKLLETEVLKYYSMRKPQGNYFFCASDSSFLTSTQEKKLALDAYIKAQRKGRLSFSKALDEKIKSLNLEPAEVYKRSNVSRQTYSKIISNYDYRPTKQTVLAFCFGLHLDLNETQELLNSAGYTLSHVSKDDLIVEYYINQGKYDICDINMELANRGFACLGASNK